MKQTPLLTVDGVIFVDDLAVLIKRKKEPFIGYYALPGGFVEIGETTENACRREVLEETNIAISDMTLINTYSDPSRDPRFHSVSIAYLCQGDCSLMEAGDDASFVELRKWRDLNLAFDHKKILEDAWTLKNKTHLNDDS